LTDVSHRLEDRRPEVEDLKTDDAVCVVDRYMDRFAWGERFQIVPLFLDRPRSIDGGMDTLGNDSRQDGHNSGSVLRDSSPYPQA